MRADGANLLAPPKVGAWAFRVLSENVLELSLVTAGHKRGRPRVWDWIEGQGKLSLPEPGDFEVRVAGHPARIRALGFRRRVAYAPLGKWDMRVDNSLYLELSGPVRERRKVSVRNIRGNAWSGGMPLQAEADPERISPAVHVNHAGYGTDLPKNAVVGHYLGSLGEMSIDYEKGFKVVDAASGKEVFSGDLVQRPGNGFHDMVKQYQRVYVADFSGLRETGRYQVEVPGLGRSFPFRIHEGLPAAVARTYALGILHQRCGTSIGFPFTRFTHNACHTRPAIVPSGRSSTVHEAAFANFYPHVRKGSVDVSGGHHDAGDYSKYLINSTYFVHALVLAADAFPGVGGLDNLGLPESGDGKGDLLQLARWEADFIASMQDEDGGFYFLVYPKGRAYEGDVPPDRGDRQVVFPKQTAATAAAVAALAQAASSPAFKREHPEAAATYLERAEKGWRFLKQAWSDHGRKGAYKKVTHYGHVFEDRDEVIWAATELFLATGRSEFADELKRFDPNSDKVWRWHWVRLFEGYGAATRSYALAPLTGRLSPERLDDGHLQRCKQALIDAGHEIARFHRASAYRTSFPLENKRHRTAGWYFSGENLFDLAAASVLQARDEFVEAMVGNMDYHLGANPLNMSYLTGLGRRRPLDIVSQWAQNDWRTMPPSGIPLGDVVAGYGWVTGYEHARGRMSFPADNDRRDPYPIYDRYADSWNTQAEPVIPVQGKCLAGAAFLMARTDLKDQPYTTLKGSIRGLPQQVDAGSEVHAILDAKGLDPDEARVVWDLSDGRMGTGTRYTFEVAVPGVYRLEVEAVWPDGRRVFARRRIEAVEPEEETEKGAESL